MRTLANTVTFALLTAAVLLGQTASSTAAKGSTGLGKTSAASNQDLNIRAYIELLRTDIKKAKVQVMGEVMQFEAGQAAAFWPIYKEFEGELSVVGDQVVAVVKEYAANYDKMT